MSKNLTPEAREQLDAELDLAGGVWVYKGQHKAPMAGVVDEPCFGECWDSLGNEDCGSCAFRFKCLDVFVSPRGALVKAATQIRNETGALVPDSEDVCQYLDDVSPASAEYALGILFPQKAEPMEKAEPEVDAGELAGEKTPTVETEPEESDVAAKKTAPAKKKKPPVKKAASAGTKKKKKAPAKKKTTKKAPTKKKAAANPSKAESVKSAKGSASTRKRKRTAGTAKARAGRVAGRGPATLEQASWGEHTHKQRFLRERQRSKLVRRLTPGMVLRRDYENPETGEVTEHTLKVMEGGYLLDGVTRCATLYAAAKEIAGVREYPAQNVNGRKVAPGETRLLSNWSGVKFWKVAKSLKALDEGRKRKR